MSELLSCREFSLYKLELCQLTITLSGGWWRSVIAHSAHDGNRVEPIEFNSGHESDMTAAVAAAAAAAAAARDITP